MKRKYTMGDCFLQSNEATCERFSCICLRQNVLEKNHKKLCLPTIFHESFKKSEGVSHCVNNFEKRLVSNVSNIPVFQTRTHGMPKHYHFLLFFIMVKKISLKSLHAHKLTYIISFF